MADELSVEQMRLALGSDPAATDDQVRAEYARLIAGWSSASEASAQPAVDLEDVKRHLRVDGDDEDVEIEIYRDAAIGWVEEYTGRSLTRQSFTWTGASFRRADWLPRRPVRAIETVAYLDGRGVPSRMLAGWRFTENGLAVAVGGAWPVAASSSDAVTISYEAGYDDTVPLPKALKVAVLMMAGHFYRNREAAAAAVSVTEVPFGVLELCRPFRQPVLG